MQETFVSITEFGALGGSQHTTHAELMGGRTPITTEAVLASAVRRSLSTRMRMGEFDLEPASVHNPWNSPRLHLGFAAASGRFAYMPLQCSMYVGCT